MLSLGAAGHSTLILLLLCPHVLRLPPILAARAQVAQAVNSGLALLYWQVGDRIRREVIQEKRADYGDEIIQTLFG
jgi:hypothetical protein